MTSPSSILSRAADLIRDTAAAAGPDEWTFEAFAPAVWEGDARWIALMSPAVAPMIEAWLRQVQVRAARSEESAALLGWAEPIYREEVGPALALARAVLGEKEEQ